MINEYEAIFYLGGIRIKTIVKSSIQMHPPTSHRRSLSRRSIVVKKKNGIIPVTILRRSLRKHGGSIVRNAENRRGRKKTRQRRGNGCRDGRDAVGVAARCRGADQYGGVGGRVWQGREGKFRGERRRDGERAPGTRAILSRFGDLESPSSSLPLYLSSILPFPPPEISSFPVPLPVPTRPVRFSFYRDARTLSNVQDIRDLSVSLSNVLLISRSAGSAEQVRGGKSAARSDARAAVSANFGS